VVFSLIILNNIQNYFKMVRIIFIDQKYFVLPGVKIIKCKQ